VVRRAACTFSFLIVLRGGQTKNGATFMQTDQTNRNILQCSEVEALQGT
jgi:hypothetical protein